MPESLIEQYRCFLKNTVFGEMDFSQTDQHRGVGPPPIEKPFADDARRLDLVAAGQWEDVRPIDVPSAVRNRRSRRRFTGQPLTLDELSFLLWATQGVQERLEHGAALRTVPSAGARYAMETYLCVFNVEGLESAVYRYLPLAHQLLFEFADEQASRKIIEATLGQSFTGRSAVTFVWTAVPYRMEWRYGIAAEKLIALDAGHVCQNLYLGCEAIRAGTCAVAAYDQQRMDRLLRVDGNDEFTIYLAPVGKL